VNFHKLGQFIEKLEDRYNPMLEFVFKAHCIQKTRMSLTFPQGGSGFVLSRFACKTVLGHRIPFFKTMLLWEDWSIGEYLRNHGFPPLALAGNNFIGHPPLAWQVRRLENNSIPSCASLQWALKKRRNHFCASYFTPLNEVVFVHAYPYQGWTRLLKLARNFFNAPPSVLWWNGIEGRAEFCREENETLRELLSFYNTPRVKWGPHGCY
jgi:hypothetical protein